MLKLSQENITDNLKVNAKIAEKQEEFITIPSHRTKSGITAYSFELDDDDMEKILKDRKIYFLQLTRGNDMQPINIAVDGKEFDEIVKWTDIELQELDVAQRVRQKCFNIKSCPGVDEENVKLFAHNIVAAGKAYLISDDSLWNRYQVFVTGGDDNGSY